MSIEIRAYIPPSTSSPQLSIAGVTRGAETISIAKRFYMPGYFEFTIPSYAKYADAFVRNSIVQIDSVFWGIVKSISYSLVGNRDVKIIAGWDLKGLAYLRTTVPPQFNGLQGAMGYDTETGSTETIMKHFMTSNFFSSLQPSRQVPGLFIASDQGRGIADDKYMTRYERMSDVLEKIGKTAQLGYDIIPDLTENKIIFDCIQGSDRRAGNGLLPPIIFAPDKKSIITQDYMFDERDSSNVFYSTMSGAEFADEALTMVYTLDDEAAASGFDRAEMHLNLSVDTPTAGAEYDELKRVAMIDAANYRPVESFACAVNNSRHQYGVDYFLGDKVTIQNKQWGVTMDAQLTSMAVNYDSSGIHYSAGFGEAPLNIFGRLNRQIKNR